MKRSSLLMTVSNISLTVGMLSACQQNEDPKQTPGAAEAKIIAAGTPQGALVAQTATAAAVHCIQDEMNAIADPAERFIEAFECGDALFGVTFNEIDGVGARVGQGQRFTRIPRADLTGAGEWATHLPSRATGPNAQTCEAGCHRAPVADGAGPVDSNVHRDPLHSGSVAQMIQRNTPAVFMLGGLQLLAQEVSVALNAARDAARAEARTTPQNPTRTVTLATKGISYGTIVVSGNAACANTGACAQDNNSGLRGVDPDLIVKPLQWKGSVRTVRDFMTDASHNELGMQAVEITGQNIDGDGDGVSNELGFGDITAMAVYQATQPRPTTKLELNGYGLLVPALTATEIASINAGAQVFQQVGCASCHMPQLALQSPVFTEPSQHPAYFPPLFPTGQNAAAVGVTPTNPVTVNLITDIVFNRGLENPAGQPVPAFGGLEANPAGGAIVRLYGDLKRHDMGPNLAENIDEVGTGASVWRTRELWGVGSTPPYLHDGRATTVLSAALEHGGEAAASVTALTARSAADRTNLVAFLENLVLFREEVEEEDDPEADVRATVTVNTDWGFGYCATINATNLSPVPVSPWNVVLNIGASTIYTSWNGTFMGNTGNVTVTPGFSWNQTIPAGATNSSIGFCANRNTANNGALPVVVSASGTI